MIPPLRPFLGCGRGALREAVGSGVVGDEIWYLGGWKMSDELEMSDVFMESRVKKSSGGAQKNKLWVMKGVFEEKSMRKNQM